LNVLTTRVNQTVDTFFASKEHDLHRRRRKPIEPYFSRHGVLKFEPLIQECAEKLGNRFSSLMGTGRIVRIDHAMEAYTADIVRRICIDEPQDFLDDENFFPEW
jgi:cytochrome P450